MLSRTLRTQFLLEFLVQELHYLYCSISNRSSGTEYCCSTRFVKNIVILCRYYTAGNYYNIFTSEFFELTYYLWNKCLMTCCKRGHSYNMNVILNSLLCSLFRSLEQRSHIYVKSAIGITCCNNLSSTVVTILPKFCKHNTWLTTLFLSKF